MIADPTSAFMRIALTTNLVGFEYRFALIQLECTIETNGEPGHYIGQVRGEKIWMPNSMRIFYIIIK